MRMSLLKAILLTVSTITLLLLQVKAISVFRITIKEVRLSIFLKRYIGIATKANKQHQRQGKYKNSYIYHCSEIKAVLKTPKLTTAEKSKQLWKRLNLILQ